MVACSPSVKYSVESLLVSFDPTHDVREIVILMSYNANMFCRVTEWHLNTGDVTFEYSLEEAICGVPTAS